MSELPKSYCGKLVVGDNDFELIAERFIPREDGAAFRFAGSDQHGGFSVEGFARKTGDIYVAGSVPVTYAYYGGEDQATIDFTAVRELNHRTECHVLGVWAQDGGTWSFIGTLRPFDAHRPVRFDIQSKPALAYRPTKRQLKTIASKFESETRIEHEKAKHERKLRKYAKRSNKKIRKANMSKARRRDIFTKGKRVKGSAFRRK